MRLSELVAGFSIAPPAPTPTSPGSASTASESGPACSSWPCAARRSTATPTSATRWRAALPPSSPSAPAPFPPATPFVRVPSSRDALALLAARFYATTSLPLSLIGFTGTFGKTSTSDILRQLLDAAGQRTGVLGSLGARYQSFVDPGEGLTTPAPVELHRALRGLADAGATTVVLEVTSHALRLGRVDGLRFDGGLLAAIMPGEHTDFHRSYEDYVEAKRLFLSRSRPDAPLAFDADNLAARRLAAEPGQHRHASPDRLHARGARCHGPAQFYDILLDGKGATFSLGGRAVSTHRASGAQSAARARPSAQCRAGADVRHRHRASRSVGARGGRVADAAAGAAWNGTMSAGGRSSTTPPAIREPCRDVRCCRDAPASRDGRRVCVRGRRGPDINRRNALALADLCSSARRRSADRHRRRRSRRPDST